MKITGSAVLHAPVDEVWKALNDPGVLVRTIPGCERLEEAGQDRYRMTITAGVASVKGTYVGEVALSDQQPPHSFVMHASGSGAPGTVQADVRVRLAPDGDGTRLHYDADAVVGGMVGGVGQRMLTAVAKRTANEFFQAVDAVLTGAAAAEPEAPEVVAPAAAGVAAEAPAAATVAETAAEPAGAPRVFTAPAKPAAGGRTGSEWWVLLAAFGAGAAWALTGVIVGARLARRRS